MLRECVLFVTVFVFGVGSHSGRGFFCRDPDTGELHHANSTWTATTFCGKYHCKLKRKNISGSQYAPLRQINITNIQLLGQNLTTVDIQKKDVFFKKEEIDNSVVSTDNTTELDTVDSNNTLKDQGITPQDIIDDKNISERDRYLSDKEIKSLTEVLHTLKKSDLEAIIEIYNLAQDIFKELDSTTKDHVHVKEAMSTTETLNKQIFKSDMFKKMTKHKHASYWYEPLSSGKIRVTDILRPGVIRNDINPELTPIATGLNVPAAVNVIPNPTPSNVLAQVNLIPSIPTFQLQKTSDSFFNGPLTNKDFGKLPYYYPISNFQRISSYKHEQNKEIRANENITPVPVPFRPTSTLATSSVPIPNSVNKTFTNKTLQISGKYQKELNPSIFLPYPFTNMQHYNWSLPQSTYHRNKIDIRRKEKRLFDKLELLRREENSYGTRRKEEYNVDPLVKRRKQESHLEKLELLTKEDFLFNQRGTRRNGEKFFDQLEKRRKQGDILDKLELLEKEANLFYSKLLGPRRKQEKLSEKLEIRSKGDTSNKNVITIKKRKAKKTDAILMNSELKNYQDLKISSSVRKENTMNANVKQENGETGRKLIVRRRPEWQTDSLPQQILDEVRAHIQEKQRLFIHPVPLRKKVKLQRVAKLLNMDRITRRKRSEEPNQIDAPLEPELYEVYIESTTCNADYEIPGYFRYGNLTQPFPGCCPQIIHNR